MEPLSNRCLIPAGPCPRPNTIDELAAELQRGVEIEAAILEHEGYQCLRRPEYQFQDSETISTPLSSQGFDLSPYDTSPPPSTESPDSVLSQDGPPVFSQTPTAGESTDFSHTSSLKRFKCSHPDCPHAASRQDHVRDHYRVHHQGIYYECDKWCVPSRLSSMVDTNLNIVATGNGATREISPLIHATKIRKYNAKSGME